MLEAVERRDRAALDVLVLSEPEFRDHVWPDLPAARPERNLPFSYVWGDLRQKSGQGLAQTLAEHGGRHYEFVRLEPTDGESRYAHSVVHRRMAMVVKEADGSEIRLRLFGSMLEKDGVFKVFSYVVDD